MTIEENIRRVRERIETAAARAGRTGGDITLVAVTKTVPFDRIRSALERGITDIGESRIQEAGPKLELVDAFKPGVRKHLIGHLQSNKIRKAVALFDVIQSADSLRLLEAIGAEAVRQRKEQVCLIEAKVSEEESKFGAAPQDLPEMMESAAAIRGVRVAGVMAMAPYFPDPGRARPYFQRAKRLFDELRPAYGLTVLSMGMSNDFETAIEEGATMVRIGTAIFDEDDRL